MGLIRVWPFLGTLSVCMLPYFAPAMLTRCVPLSGRDTVGPQGEDFPQFWGDPGPPRRACGSAEVGERAQPDGHYSLDRSGPGGGGFL